MSAAPARRTGAARGAVKGGSASKRPDEAGATRVTQKIPLHLLSPQQITQAHAETPAAPDNVVPLRADNW